MQPLELSPDLRRKALQGRRRQNRLWRFERRQEDFDRLAIECTGALDILNDVPTAQVLFADHPFVFCAVLQITAVRHRHGERQCPPAAGSRLGLKLIVSFAFVMIQPPSNGLVLPKRSAAMCQIVCGAWRLHSSVTRSPTVSMGMRRR